MNEPSGLSIRFQADADLKFAIVEGVRQREPAIDSASATDSSLEGISDPELLESSAAEDRILITHDRRTMLVSSLPFAVGGRKNKPWAAHRFSRGVTRSSSERNSSHPGSL